MAGSPGGGGGGEPPPLLDPPPPPHAASRITLATAKHRSTPFISRSRPIYPTIGPVISYTAGMFKYEIAKVGPSRRTLEGEGLFAPPHMRSRKRRSGVD